ncbi:MAG TPA: hypothetical protein PK514_15355 [Spirochaetota bacterium]|nr:hypothetical protein [Spirochaetota bacterium]
MKRFFSLTALILILCIPALRLDAADKLAFGYFINTTGDEEYDYLEEVFPKSIASAMRNRYKVRTMSPNKLQFLVDKNTNALNKAERMIYEDDLAVLSESIPADILIYGTFTPDDNNRVKVRISVYKIGSDTVFTFEDTGELEMGIFRLVDKIATQLKNYIDKHTAYKLDVIKKKSKVAILSNIEGDELNRCYYAFMTSGYRVSPIHGNDLYSYLDDDSIERFMKIEAANASLDYVTAKSQVELLHGTWSGVKYYRDIISARATYNRFAFNFKKSMDEVLASISRQDSELDYIIIIGFNDDHDTAWYRCVDIRNNRLMSFQYGIEGDSVDEVTKKIITDLTSPLAVIE